MRHLRVLLIIAGLAALCACRGIHSFTAGVDQNNSSPISSHSVTGSAALQQHPRICALGVARRERALEDEAVRRNELPARPTSWE